MDTLHTVLRSIRGETKSARRDHLTVFREFLNQLDRVTRRPRGDGVKRQTKTTARRGK